MNTKESSVKPVHTHSERCCEGCQAVFAPTRPWHRCCSTRCRARAWRAYRKQRLADLAEAGNLEGLREAIDGL